MLAPDIPGDLCPLRAFAMEKVASEQAAHWTTGFSLELRQELYIYIWFFYAQFCQNDLDTKFFSFLFKNNSIMRDIILCTLEKMQRG